LEKNLAQYKANERNLKHKLKAYQNNFSNFICGNPTTIEVLGQDEKRSGDQWDSSRGRSID
jgi:hypothetical protein